jgi:adenylate cyclase
VDVQEHRRRLAAILSADAAAYSRLMAADEAATVQALDAARAVFQQQAAAHLGRIVDTAGDSVLAVFETAAGAVSAALGVQAAIDAAGGAGHDDRRLRFRIGVHLGDVLEKADGTVYGDGVNIAARLQALAEPGGVAVSESVRTAVAGKVGAAFRDLGAQAMKNIAEPVHAYAAAAAPATLAAAAGVDVAQPVPGFGGRPAVAVLPFANLSGDPEQEYFADGLADDILTRLALWRWIPVIARNSSFSFRGRGVDVKAVGRALGARYVLEGSVRKAGNRVRVTGQLIDAETGHHLWAQSYDRVLEDLFAIQDELTEGIVGAIEGVMGRAEVDRARRRPPGSVDAWQEFHRGLWHLWRPSPEDCAKAEQLFHRASELDPGSALAHGCVAVIRLYQLLFRWTDNPAAALADGLAQARVALDLDPTDPLAAAVFGVLLPYAGKHDEALDSCRKAIELNPSYAAAHHCLATVHYWRGELQPGMRAIETAIRLSPNDPLLPSWVSLLSALLRLSGEPAKAAELVQGVVQRAPHYPVAWKSLAMALGQLGQLGEARQAMSRFLELAPGLNTEQALRDAYPFRDEVSFQQSLDDMRKAGWPS